MKLLNKKRNSSKDKEIENILAYERIRKKLDDDISRKYCKYPSDSIIKKIKLKLLENVISRQFLIKIMKNPKEEFLKIRLQIY